MPSLYIQEYAQKSLDDLEIFDEKIYQRMMSFLEDLENHGTQLPGVKKLVNSESIYRKRIGRYRILFTYKNDRIDIWLIEIEKDTKKDYKRWVRYINRHFYL